MNSFLSNKNNSKINLFLWKIFLLTFFLKGIQNVCNTGCLECDKTQDICLLCDFVNLYEIDASGSSCQKHDPSVSNCIELDIDYKCTSCISHFYYNSNFKKCVEVPEKKKQENCLHYVSEDECTICSGLLYVFNKVCEPIEAEISNCVVYLSSLQCKVCKKGYLPTMDQLSCQKVNEIENCASFSWITCDECSGSNILDKSLYLYNSSDWKQNEETKANLQKQLRASSEKYDVTFDDAFEKVCEVPKVLNCQSFLNAYICSECDSNFLVNQTKDVCLPFPESPIANCIEYDSRTECLKCSGNNYVDLDNPTKCKTVDPIPNCKTYKQNLPACYECEDDYFLDIGDCVKRIKSIVSPGCLKKSRTIDLCEKCQSDFALLSTGQCVAGLIQCVEYNLDAETKSELECLKCNETFFVNQTLGFCKSGTDLNCKIFIWNQDKCEQCKEGFYLKDIGAGNFICSAHSLTIDNCDEYSFLTQNKCNVCKPGYVLYQNRNVCQEILEPIPKCLVYNSPTNCRECSDFYSVPNCSEIDASKKCKQINKDNSNFCDDCKDGNFTNMFPYQRVCQTPYEAFSLTCQTITLPENSERFVCEDCMSGKFPIIFDDEKHYLCERRTRYIGSDDNCLLFTYDEDTEELTCDLCGGLYKLNSDNECVLECESDEVLLKVDIQLDENDEFFTVNGKEKCIAEDTLTNCKFAVPSLSDGPSAVPTVICGECDATYQEVIPIDADPVHTHNWDKAAGVFKEYQHSPQVECKQITLSDLHGSIDIANCDKFIEVTDGKFACVKCNLGFTGKVIEVDDSTLNINPIYVIEQCNQSVEYCLNAESDFRGLSKSALLTSSKLKIPWESYISCFKCFGSDTKIPFVYFVWDSSEKKPLLKHYNLDKDILTEDVTSFADSDPIQPNGNSMACLDYKIAADFSVNAGDVPIFIENCAIGGYNLEGNSSDSKSANGFAVCIACLPGYKPEFLDGYPFIIKCNQDLACDNSIVMNECSYCGDGKIIHSTSFDCISQTIPDINCYMGLTDECYVCNDGFSVNLDGVCEKIDAPLCEQGYTFLPNGYRTTHIDMFTTNYDRLSFGGGVNESVCGQCQVGYTGIAKLTQISTLCVDSSYLTEDDFRHNTNYITDCKQLKYDYEKELFVCAFCKSGFMPSFDRKRCVPQTAFCNLASDSGDTLCNRCNDNFSLANGKCFQHKIKDCQVFYTDSHSVFCKQCNAGFYLDMMDLECNEGNIPNCNLYRKNDPDHCIECVQDYTLFRNNLGKTICLSSSQVNCLSWDDDNDFYCSLCKQGFFPTTDFSFSVRSVCIGGNFEIENCEIMDEEFTCTKCNDGFYLNLKRDACIALVTPLLNCSVASLDEPKCVKCEDQYYLKKETGECFPYPSGISNCSNYLDIENCKTCLIGFYLSENECREVTELIPDCEVYSSNTVCKQCKDGFGQNPDAELISDICKPITAKNCLTISDMKTCSSCEEGKGIMKDGNSMSCLNLNTVSGCVEHNFNSPFNCLKCNSLKYLNNGECLDPTLLISNCLEYESENTCAKCRSGYVTNSTKNQCQSMNSFSSIRRDNSCEFYSQSLRGFSCSTCLPGFDLSNSNTCEAIPANNHCAFFEDVNLTKCKICSPGYSMDVNGICLKNNEITSEDNSTDDGSSDDDTRTDDPDKSTSILGLVSFFTIYLIFF